MSLCFFLFCCVSSSVVFFFFFQAEDGIRDTSVTGVQTCALPIWFGARYLGGGTNLVDLMKLGVEAPVRLVDVTRLPHAAVEDTPGGGLRIGAADRKSVV